MTFPHPLPPAGCPPPSRFLSSAAPTPTALKEAGGTWSGTGPWSQSPGLESQVWSAPSQRCDFNEPLSAPTTARPHVQHPPPPCPAPTTPASSTHLPRVQHPPPQPRVHEPLRRAPPAWAAALQPGSATPTAGPREPPGVHGEEDLRTADRGLTSPHRPPGGRRRVDGAPAQSTGLKSRLYLFLAVRVTEPPSASVSSSVTRS